MTEKHIWENGETITADLLNAMSDYVDDKASTAVKTAETAAALTSDENLLTGTSAEWQTSNLDYWGNEAGATNGVGLKLIIGTTYSYAAEIHAPDAQGQRVYAVARGAGVEFYGNIISAGESGLSTVTFTVPDGTTTVDVFPKRLTTNIGKDKVTVQWRKEKLNIGPYPTPYSKRAVTSVGGQQAGSDGDINMDAYAQLSKANTFTAPQTFTGGISTISLPADANLDTIKTSGWYWAPIDGGQFFLWVMVYNNIVEQIKFGFQSGNISTRRFDSARWSDWTTMATQADTTALNNKISALEAQISGGGAEPG